MSNDVDSKLELAASMLDGRVVKHENGPAVSVHGYIVGFPCRLEALRPDWPFGVTYFIDTEIIANPDVNKETFQLDILPRVGKGLLGFFMRLVVFEAAGMKVGEKELEKEFVFSFANRPLVQRFLRYPGVSETLLKLHRVSSFNELKIVSNAGLYLSQGTCFSKIDLDICRETFRLLGEIGQVLYEAF